MAKQPKPKTGGSRNDSRPNGKAVKSGARGSKPTGDVLSKGFETKFLNDCKKAGLTGNRSKRPLAKSERRGKSDD